MENDGNGQRPIRINGRQLALVVPSVGDEAQVNEFGHAIGGTTEPKPPLDPAARRQAVLAEHASTQTIEISKLRREAQDNQILVRTLRSQLSSSTQKCELSQTALDEAQRQLAEHDSKLKAVALSLVELEGELQELQPLVLTNFERRLTEQRYADLQGERDRLIELAANFPLSLSSALAERDALATEMVHLRWALGEADAGRTALSDEMGHLRWALGEAITELEVERNAHATVNAELTRAEAYQRTNAARLETQRARLQGDINSLQASRSWRITAPLRAFNARWQRFTGRI